MVKLVLDTCSWIKLSKPKFSKVLEKLEKFSKTGLGFYFN